MGFPRKPQTATNYIDENARRGPRVHCCIPPLIPPSNRASRFARDPSAFTAIIIYILLLLFCDSVRRRAHGAGKSACVYRLKSPRTVQNGRSFARMGRSVLFVFCIALVAWCAIVNGHPDIRDDLLVEQLDEDNWDRMLKGEWMVELWVDDDEPPSLLTPTRRRRCVVIVDSWWRVTEAMPRIDRY